VLAPTQSVKLKSCLFSFRLCRFFEGSGQELRGCIWYNRPAQQRNFITQEKVKVKECSGLVLDYQHRARVSPMQRLPLQGRVQRDERWDGRRQWHVLEGRRLRAKWNCSPLHSRPNMRGERHWLPHVVCSCLAVTPRHLRLGKVR